MRTGALLSTEMRNDGGSPKSNYEVGLTRAINVPLPALRLKSRLFRWFSFLSRVPLPSIKVALFLLRHLHSSCSLCCNSPSNSPRRTGITNGLSLFSTRNNKTLRCCSIFSSKCTWEDVCALCTWEYGVFIQTPTKREVFCSISNLVVSSVEHA